MAAALAAVVTTGCGGNDDDGSGDGARDDGAPIGAVADAVRIASFDFEESRLIAELYAQALEGGGIDVVRLGAIGPREVVAPALEQGQIDVVPEYVGTAAQHFGATTDDLRGLRAALRPRDLRALQPAPAQDVNVFVVTETTAREHRLTTVGDLATVAAGFRIGGPVECPGRPLCLGGLDAVYGLTFAEFVPHRNLAITAEALLRDEVEVGVMFSTSPEVTSGPFVILDDDRGLQPADNIVPVITVAAAERWDPELPDILNWLSHSLTTAELQAMNRRAQNGEPLPDIAASWLRSISLLSS